MKTVSSLSLKPLPPPPGIELKASPLTGKMHEWRLIDFEYAFQTNLVTDAFLQFYGVDCGHFFQELAENPDPDVATYDLEDEDDEGDDDGYDE